MTKGAALNSFFSGFGIDAYPDSGVPKDANFPYLTYSVVSGAFPDGDTTIDVNLWYNTEGEKVLNDKVQEISKAIGGGLMINVDEGILLINRGSPFAQSMAGDNTGNVKRRYVNISAKWFTLN